MRRYLAKYYYHLKQNLIDFQIYLRVRNKVKIFCIGQNKTGTTSLYAAFKDLGLVVADQEKAEALMDFYAAGEFDPIIKYCRYSQVFQDFPFSYPETFKIVDQAFPGSKFILSVRDNPEQWYQSYTRFLAKVAGNGKLPDVNDLKNHKYIWKGWFWKSVHELFKTPENDIFNKDALIKHYIKYNNDVIEYFKNRPDDLIIINLSEKGDYKRLMDFLNISSPYNSFPWINKTDNVVVNSKGFMVSN